MNLDKFYKIHTINGDRYFGDSYCSLLFDYYVTGGLIFKYDVNITEDEFNRVFNIIYDRLKLKLSEDEIKKSFLQYIQMIMGDARSGVFVDIHYFIKCVDYLSLDILDNKCLRKVKHVSKDIKKNLISEFGKVKRR